MDLGFHLAMSYRDLKHPTSRKNFAAVVGQNHALILTQCLMQETVQESNEKMHCDGGLPQYKTSRKIKACNKKQDSWLFIDQ